MAYVHQRALIIKYCNFISNTAKHIKYVPMFAHNDNMFTKNNTGRIYAPYVTVYSGRKQ